MHGIQLQLEYDEDSGVFTVTSPDVPGLVTEGSTPQEIQHNVQEALAGLLEVWPEIKQTIELSRAAKIDRYRLGWRVRPRVTSTGRVVYERIPLTSYDILHPQEEDFRVHNDEHRLFCRYLDNVISAQVAHDPSAIVLHDTRVAWDVPGLEPHGPDIALIFGVRERKKWGTFDVKEEGVRPGLIIEVTSPETRRLDLEDKVDEYALAGVPYYIIVDAYKSRKHPAYELLGNQLTPDGYQDMQPNEKGWLWLEPAQIWIGLRGDLLECYDRQGNRIGDYIEINAAYQAAEARAEEAEQRVQQEAQARAELEARLQSIEAELKQLRNQKQG
ncbi:MAG: Uma2 family endonuclease [Caldilineaceae bacterium]